jgi:hypothetical protein
MLKRKVTKKPLKIGTLVSGIFFFLLKMVSKPNFKFFPRFMKLKRQKLLGAADIKLSNPVVQ